MLSRTVGKAKLFQIATEREKPKVKVRFLKNYLHYRAGQIASVSEDEASELIRSGFAEFAT